MSKLLLLTKNNINKKNNTDKYNEFSVKGLFNDSIISEKIYNFVKNKKILEIGGPSFNNYWIPKFYELSEYTDIVNLDEENNIALNLGCKHKNTDKKKIRNFFNLIIDDTYDYLKKINNDYDIILTAHVLEHQANPIKQLLLWKKLLKKDGIFIHILPEKSLTSDHNRPFTNINKLINNYNNNILEDDTSEIDDIIKYKNKDPTKILGITNIDRLNHLKNNKELVLKFKELHHHVYDFNLLDKLSNFLNFKQILNFNIYLDNWVFWVQN